MRPDDRAVTFPVIVLTGTDCLMAEHRTDEQLLKRELIPLAEFIVFAYCLVTEHRLPAVQTILFWCPLAAFVCFTLVKVLVWVGCVCYTYFYRSATRLQSSVIT